MLRSEQVLEEPQNPLGFRRREWDAGLRADLAQDREGFGGESVQGEECSPSGVRERRPLWLMGSGAVHVTHDVAKGGNSQE